jgi:hypothetical protein
LAQLTDIKENLVFVPKRMPLGQGFWVIATGISFVLAGLTIISGIQDVGGTSAALMFVVFNLVALPPFILAYPKDHCVLGRQCL